ncbi:hypothetical protein MIR68_004334 [Amoeboaphelidium protococcarum]|nr:hypothetical protein MIR68_004334 [Amoeboaphelidium protococcarum]
MGIQQWKISSLVNRYLVKFVVIPIVSFGLILLFQTLVRITGPCMVSFNGTPEFEIFRINCAELTGEQRTAMILSQVAVFGSPIFAVFLIYPLHLSYPHYLNWQRCIKLIVPMFLFIVVTAVFVMQWPESRNEFMAVRRAVTPVYWLIFVPYLFKQDYRNLHRNVQLLQFEHDSTCCKEPITVRDHRSKSWIEWMIILSVMWLILSVECKIWLNINLNYVLAAFLIAICYLCWRESGLHFYRDFSYAYLMSVLPVILVELCISLWEINVQLQMWNDYGYQVLLVFGYNVLVLVIAHSIKTWAQNCIDDKNNVMLAMYPFRLFASLFQYLLVFSIPASVGPYVWIASIIVLVANVLDLTHVLSDLYDKLKPRTKLLRGITNRNNNSSRNKQHFNQQQNHLRYESEYHMNWIDLNSSEVSSLTASPHNARELMDYLVNVIVMALDTIHQHVYCVMLMSTFTAAVLLLDFLPQNGSQCTISCPSVQRNKEVGFYWMLVKLAVIYFQYFIAVFIAILLWRWRIMKLIDKYPQLRDFISEPIDGDGGRLMNLNNLSGISLDTLGSGGQMSRYERYQKELVHAQKLLIRGHISARYLNFQHAAFLICSIVWGFVAIFCASVTFLIF